ncbi:hypothetical protein C2E23DRAFT_389855 [Lenzites betulinus]|nr:hypothetical protein C2E23DRAFT_389855 [Lenzites betulinus]
MYRAFIIVLQFETTFPTPAESVCDKWTVTSKGLPMAQGRPDALTYLLSTVLRYPSSPATLIRPWEKRLSLLWDSGKPLEITGA